MEIRYQKLRRTKGAKADAVTLEEYLATPETVLPQELVFGTLRVADAPFVSHQRVVLRLAVALEEVARPVGSEVFVAPSDVILDADRALVLQPDLLLISPERADIVRERIYGAPDLIVEVLSPQPRIGEINERVHWFAEYGVAEIWLYRQNEQALEVLTCDRRAIVARTSFARHAPVRSRVLPQFTRTPASVVDGC